MVKNNDLMSYNKKVLRASAPSLALIIGIIIALWLFRMSVWWQVASLVTGGVTIYELLKSPGVVRSGRWWGRRVLMFAQVSVFVLLIRWLGSYGWWGFVVIVLGFAGYKLWRGRSEYLRVVRLIEQRVFGHTNDLKKKKNKKED